MSLSSCLVFVCDQKHFVFLEKLDNDAQEKLNAQITEGRKALAKVKLEADQIDPTKRKGIATPAEVTRHKVSINGFILLALYIYYFSATICLQQQRHYLHYIYIYGPFAMVRRRLSPRLSRHKSLLTLSTNSFLT